MKCCWLANLFRGAADCHPGLRNWFTEFAHKDFSFIKNMLEKQEMIMKINETSWKRTISLFRLRKYCTKNLVSLGLLCFGVNLATSCSTEMSWAGQLIRLFLKICSYVICFVTLEITAASMVIGSERKLLQGRTCKDFFEIYL